MPSEPQAVRITTLRLILASVFLFMLTTLTFINAVNADFVNWDDDVYVTENPYVGHLTADTLAWIFTHGYYYAWTPLTLLSHAFDVSLWDLNPRWHHLTNVLLHASNSVWVFLIAVLVAVLSPTRSPRSESLIGRVTGGVLVGAFIAALLYATHPLRVEPVAWVSGRKDVLCAFFLLPAFATFLLWRARGGEIFLIATHVLFALALLSKPHAVVFPLALVLMEAWWLWHTSERPSLLHLTVDGKLLLFLMSVVVGIITFVVAGHGPVNVTGELSKLENLFLPPYALMFYLWKTILPFDLSPVYPEVPRTMLYLSGVAGVALTYACLVLFQKNRRGPALAFSLYALTVLPVFFGLSSGAQPIADRYTYLSTISIFVLIGAYATWVWEASAASPAKWYRREAIVVLLLVLCGLNAYRSVRHATVWYNGVTLWTQAARYAPTTPQEYEQRGPYLRPNYLDAFINLGTAYSSAGQPERAMEQFQRVLLFDSCNADAHYNLGTLEFERGNEAESVRRFHHAIACDSTYAKAYYNLGILYSRHDSTEHALVMFQNAARLGMIEAQRVLQANGYGW